MASNPTDAAPDPTDTSATPDHATIDADASRAMKRGMALMQQGDPPSVMAALACFDEALALRQQLPVDEQPKFLYGLAACWLNRAEALLVIGGTAGIDGALDAFDEAIALLQRLPLDADTLYPRRLAIAHQNRGLALSALAPPRIEASMAAFQHALNILESPASAAIEDRAYLTAAAWVNLARVRIMTKDATIQDVGEAAMAALQCVDGFEQGELGAADIGLKARHLLCQALARVLPSLSARDAADLQTVHAATDAVDDGLALIAGWEQRGIDRFRDVASDLLRFGARVYRAFQPQFLQEFIDEQFDPARSSEAYVNSPEIRLAAEDVMALRT